MACCVVVDKEQAVTDVLRHLHENGIPVPSEAISGFHEDMAPVDPMGNRLVVDPSTPWPPRPPSIGPVRVWGYVASGRTKPLAHTKLLVLGTVSWFKNYSWPEAGGEPEYERFDPELAWFGSANWTWPAAVEHLEMGAFTTDPEFVGGCYEYISRVVLESEPLGSGTLSKTPEMQPVEFDSKAFAEYFGEWGPDVEDEW